MNSLKKPMAALTLGIAFAGSLGASAAAPKDSIPPLAGDAPVVARNCSRLAAAQVLGWGDVERWQLVYVWKSSVKALFEFQPTDAYRTEQYCSRLRLFRADRAAIETSTFLCSVANRGTPTEVWSFGNRDPAAAICELSDDDIAAIDRNAPLAEGAVAPRPTAAIKQPVSPAIGK